jgi:hypothetical protein
MALCRFLSLLDEVESFGSILAAEELVLFAFELVVVDEEVFELFEEVAGKVAEFFDVGVHVIGLSDGDEAVVADAFFAVDLFAADDADEARGDETAGEGGLVHEEEDVDGVTSSARVRGRKPKS